MTIQTSTSTFDELDLTQILSDSIKYKAIVKFCNDISNADEISDRYSYHNNYEYLQGLMQYNIDSTLIDFLDYYLMKNFHGNINENMRCNNLNNQKTYIIFNPINNYYKIGKTSNIKARMSSIRNGAIGKLELVLLINADVEKELHVKFAMKKVESCSEWFTLHDDDLEYVRTTYSDLLNKS